MRLNHSDAVVDLEGEPILNGDKPFTFRDLVMNALNGQDGQPMGAEMKARIFETSTKFYRGKFVKLTVDEAALIKDMGGRFLGAMGYGRLCEWLEGEPPVVATDVDDDDGADD